MTGLIASLTEKAQDVTYDAVRAILRPIVESLVLTRAEGIENVPLTGPVLFVGNHRSVLDPLVLGAILPRHVHFVAATWMGAAPGINAILRGMGILILPASDRANRLSIVGCEHLKAGAALCIFPEGAWPALGPPPKGEVAPFHHGAARIILDCGIPDLPVVPLAIAPGPEHVALRLPADILRQLDPSDPLGARKNLEFMAYDTVTVRFGAPVSYAVPASMEDVPRSDVEKAISSSLHDAVARLLQS